MCVSLWRTGMGNAYFGSKATAGLCQALIALMPPHSVYIETHLGGGAIMKRKPGALRNIGIDLDERALAGFECDYPVELVHGCCHRFLREYPFDGTELVYSDPPYLHRTRKSARRYRHDYGDADHEALLGLLRSLPCAAMVSGYPSAFYDERLPGWRSASVQVMNQAGAVTEEGVVQLRAGPGALGELGGAQLHGAARRSSARRPAGAGATGRCRRRSAWRCWPRSWRWRPNSPWRR